MHITRYLLDCGWSLRDRPTTHRWQGRNGIVTIGDPDLGVPYGLDRLIVLYLTHKVAWAGKRQTSAEIRGNLAEIGALFGLHWRPDKSLQRLSRVALCSYATPGNAVAAPGRRRFLADEVTINDSEFHMVLSSAFIEDLHASAPALPGAVKGIARYPGALALYLWQAWHHHHGTASMVPAFGPDAPFHGTAGRCTRAKLRQMMRKRQALVRKAWPQCPYVLIGDALHYRPNTGRHLRCDKSRRPRPRRTTRATLARTQ